ncbi:unnamed protein product [Prunus brigantina]
MCLLGLVISVATLGYHFTNFIFEQRYGKRPEDELPKPCNFLPFSLCGLFVIE